MSESNYNLLGFCHRHPKMEKEKNLDKDHVIVDLNDWNKLRSINLNFKCLTCGKRPEGNFNLMSTFDNNSSIQSFSWICNECKNKIVKLVKEYS